MGFLTDYEYRKLLAGQTFLWRIRWALHTITGRREDRLLFDQISGDMVNDERLAEQARANSKEQFKHVFDPQATQAFVSRHGRNEKIVNDFMSNPEMRAFIIAALREEVYQRARA